MNFLRMPQTLVTMIKVSLKEIKIVVVVKNKSSKEFYITAESRRYLFNMAIYVAVENLKFKVSLYSCKRTQL